VTFGDFDTDDALDTEPADPEQVARRLQLLWLREGFEIVDWDALDDVERGRRITLAAVLLDWLRRQGALR
jgi:hypothetical protein